jgi:hypothetical protein
MEMEQEEGEGEDSSHVDEDAQRQGVRPANRGGCEIAMEKHLRRS